MRNSPLPYVVLTMLAAAPLARAQDGGASGASDRAPAGAGGMGLVPIPPASGGGGGASGKGGGGGASGAGVGARGGGTGGATACDAFMPCTDPSQGHGAMIAFVVSLGPSLPASLVAKVRVAVEIGGNAVSWSPREFPDDGQAIAFPLTTPFIQTCASAYGNG